MEDPLSSRVIPRVPQRYFSRGTIRGLEPYVRHRRDGTCIAAFRCADIAATMRRRGISAASLPQGRTLATATLPPFKPCLTCPLTPVQASPPTDLPVAARPVPAMEPPGHPPPPTDPPTRTKKRGRRRISPKEIQVFGDILIKTTQQLHQDGVLRPSQSQVFIDWPGNHRYPKTHKLCLTLKPYNTRVERALNMWGYNDWDDYLDHVLLQ